MMHGTVRPRGREWLWRTKCQWCPRKPPSVVHWSTDAMAWRQMWRWIYYGGLYLCAYRVASAGLSTLSSVYLGLGPESQPQYHIPSADPYPQSRNPKPDPRPDRNEIPKSLKLNLWLHLNHASKKQHKLRIYASVLGARVGCFWMSLSHDLGPPTRCRKI